MRKTLMALLMLCWYVAMSVGIACAQAPAAATPELEPTSGFAIQSAHLPFLARDAMAAKPFSTVGPRGAILGQQDGICEGWIFPWKVFSGLRMTAEMEGYPVPIDVNEYASSVEVEPDHTTIIFSHPNFTVRQVLFAPQNAPDGTGAMAFFEIEAIRPMTLTFHFTPEMKRMWPALSDDRPSPEWVKTANASSGFYVLHLNFPEHAAALAIPGSQPGILEPYQERPKMYPLEFVLHFDPARDGGRIYPLLMTVSDAAESSTTARLAAKLQELNSNFQGLYQGNQKYYQDFIDHHLRIETPDKGLDAAFTWAEISINQLRVQTTPKHDETALVAGFYESGDSARPGFGWYFGRDALWTLYAVDSYGDFQLARDEFNFLIRRQSPEGKIMHEWSQTANLVDWASLPYEFASSDATPLLIMAMNDYLNVSGDKAYITSQWAALEKAWRFETTHDSDRDGVYENTEGTGWVESWPPGMPHQEIYLAALDQQASAAYANLARATGHSEAATIAEKRAQHIAQQIEKEYFLPQEGFYAFSKNKDGSVDASSTIYPSVAAWDGTLRLAQAGPMLDRWASAEFSTDWGTRDLSPKVSFYDPISYHQGTVWPLFTGWVSLAEYRSGRSLSGYAHLMQNADLTWAQDLGNVTELLSGQYFQPLGRSTAHQLWSSAMVISPAIRGLFGVEWEAETNTLMINPNLPADWNQAKLIRIPVGSMRSDIAMERKGAYLLARISGGGNVNLRSRVPGAKVIANEIQIPLPVVEVGITHELPTPGSVTSKLKVLEQQIAARSIILKLSAPAKSSQRFTVRVNRPGIKVLTDDAQLDVGESGLGNMEVHFPEGQGYVEKTVTLRW